ncbi:thiamine pyrophosphate-dependent dehydrogenase E1 component subunit alpha [Saccharopolyspora sp. 5N708]|uniref:thiamine pyrophosphate-dependent dehydrogenase E1 component subunit alpha n=1 Tax=Saccharopolyspora sp. 5N708 TaxID=3457424 RepID=UPI003FD5918D
MNITDDKLREIYQISFFAKELDEKVQQLLMAGTINTTWFSWRGSELLGAVVGKSMRADDYLVAYYRDGMSQMAKGFPAKKLFAEALGKVTGSQQGKSGWVHSVDLESGVVMNSGVVGGQVPIAAGWALSSVLRGDDKVTVCNFGDGAANEGAFHEGLTLASLWQLPVVYVCHNNLYAEHTAFGKTSPVDHVADRAMAYNVPSTVVDGDDVPKLWEVMTTAIDRARAGGGPTLIEAMTYRFRGHTRYDPMAYIATGEVDERVRRDPVVRFRESLVANGNATEEQLKAIEAQAVEDVEEAWQFADNSAYPDVEVLHADVFAPAPGV